MFGARNTYLDKICQLIQHGQDMVIVNSDQSAPVFDKYRTIFPDKFVNVGIAEQNLVVISCGISLAGKRVIAYGMAPFTCTRAFDQVKNAMAMMHLPISYIATGSGFSNPEMGATHYNVEDISIMRTVSGLKIINVTDNVMANALANYALITEGPLYIRFDKESEGNIYQENEINFNKGFKVFNSGKDVALISYGYHLTRLLKLKNLFLEKNVDAKIIDLYCIPFDKKQLIKELAEVKSIVTIEEHVLQGGIGSIILELLSDYEIEKKVKRLGIDFKEYPTQFGSREHFMRLSGLDDEYIIKSVTG